MEDKFILEKGRDKREETLLYKDSEYKSLDSTKKKTLVKLPDCIKSI